MNIPSTRLISLDALRGFTIALMIIVNFPGNEEAVFFPLRHSAWNGLSLTDQVCYMRCFLLALISFRRGYFTVRRYLSGCENQADIGAVALLEKLMFYVKD
jgi:predicted acyltransferase